MSKKITRRRFLTLSAKALAAVCLISLFPLKWGYKKTKILMRVKPFNRSDLYKKHRLAG